jgi:hypothetical protein
MKEFLLLGPCIDLFSYPETEIGSTFQIIIFIVKIGWTKPKRTV